MGNKIRTNQTKIVTYQNSWQPSSYFESNICDEDKRIRSALLQNIDANVQYWIDCEFKKNIFVSDMH